MNKRAARIATSPVKSRNRGFSLMEVLIAMIIFAVGILAFSLLQGNLTRTSLDARMRTISTNIAEEVIETQRRFTRLGTDTVGSEFAYQDIASGSSTVTRAGIDFTITRTVTDYYWNKAAGQFSTTAAAGQAYSDFKRLDVNVAWENPLEFIIEEGVSTSGNLGSGSINLTSIISSAVTASDRLALIDDLNGDSFQPPVNYIPGLLPEVLTVPLGGDRFRESTTPVPDVISADELVETSFDVVTYTSSNSGSTFFRREEFRVVSCECTLNAPPLDADDGGRRPTSWNGVEYALGEMVAKPYGLPANNQQSTLCDLCCRDHHDGGSGPTDDANDPGRSRYDPFRAVTGYHAGGAFAGDHKHYDRSNNGELVLADSDGDPYVEACRLVRKDGFFKVAQDLRQEGMLAFPGDYLDQSSEEAQYAGYLGNALTALVGQIGDGYELAPPSLPLPTALTPPVVFPASTSGAPTSLPTATNATSQQLRSRALYLDYLSDDLRAIYSCMLGGGSGATCGGPDAVSALEILPFYDVQLTWLARWNEIPTNLPVDVSNQAVATGNTHSRGLAELSSGTGLSLVQSTAHVGNLGLTATDPINFDYLSQLRSANLHVSALVGTPPPIPGSLIVMGEITSAVNGVQAARAEIFAQEAQCDRTNTGYICLVNLLANNPRITVSNYGKHNRVMLACSPGLVVQVSNTGANPYTTFDLPVSGLPPVTAPVVIKEDACQ